MIEEDDYEGIPEDELTLEQLRKRNSDAWFKRHPEVKRNGSQRQHINPELDSITK